MTGPEEANAARKRLARHLTGSGIEVGPGEYPFRLLPPGASVRFVDRWRPEERRTLLAELRPDVAPGAVREFVAPDFVADFNKDRLRAVADSSEDFVIASHVLEHLAEPIGFVAEIHRVLRPGGCALILLPDRHRTEDRFRPPTPLSHLVAEYESGVEEVSDAHVIEALKDRGISLKGSPEERRRLLERYKEQSIHVHCWDAQEFVPVLLWGIKHLDQQWEFVDGCLYEAPIHYEFGFLLRRSEKEMDATERSRRFDVAWQAWRDHQVTLRPDIAHDGRSYRLPPWMYQRARRLVRQYRAPAWAYRKTTHAAHRCRRLVRVGLRSVQRTGPRPSERKGP